MSGGDWFVALFVGSIFFLGIYGGFKLFMWNKKNHESLMIKNQESKNSADVRKRNDGETTGHARSNGTD